MLLNKRRFKQGEGKCKGCSNEVDLKQLTHSKIFNTDFQFFKIIYFSYMLKFRVSLLFQLNLAMFIETSIILGFKAQINTASLFLIAIIFLQKKDTVLHFLVLNF